MPKGIIIQAGKLSKRVTIKSPVSATATQNDFGEPTGTPATLATRWAEVTPVGGNESFEANQVIARATHRIRLRHLAGVTPGCEISFDSRTLFIGYVLDSQEDGWELELIAGEKVSA